ncbi:unnamed protein product [Prunus armeniaca]|uniref:Histidine kinase/HSP90-like ATPase domain-containing protein n=1 Tax=Prunus armeniaca TaxID=36596 RepID=A0A6J5WLL7_PRUAR|nr:unnamed protein product [Prunus armeniaca]
MILFESLIDKSKLDGQPELFVHFIPDKNNNTLTIIDSGIGMTKAVTKCALYFALYMAMYLKGTTSSSAHSHHTADGSNTKLSHTGSSSAVARYCPCWALLCPHSFVSRNSRATSQWVTHLGIALAPTRLTSEFP